MKKTYITLTGGWILGQLRKKGQTVHATDEEAKYLLQNETIAEKKEASEKDATADGSSSEAKDAVEQSEAAPATADSPPVSAGVNADTAASGRRNR